ncbi:MAG: poly-gamma-glutamate capsule biosynthesis protein CapA/YwtB (metallophosphatase superfamily) [Myxococcota bacterium]
MQRLRHSALWVCLAFGWLAGCASAPAAPAQTSGSVAQRRLALTEDARHSRGQSDRAPEVRIIAGGDVIYGRYLKRGLRRAGGPDPFAAIADRLRAADLAILNLETPLTDVEPVIRPSAYGKWLKFRGPTAFARTLADSGIDVAILANNHAEDCGKQGIQDTMSSLSTAGITHIGTSLDGGDPFEPVQLPLDGRDVWMVAATAKRNRGKPRPGAWIPVAYGTIAQLTEWLPARVRALREGHPGRTIIVSLHWGAGFEARIHPGQIRLAHAVIDAGADVILGHHAHILQAIEQHGDGLIIYGMGNLVFDMRDRRGRRTALFDLTLRRRDGRLRAAALTVHPLVIPNMRRGPQPARPDQHEDILKPIARPARKRFKTAVSATDDGLQWRWVRPESE